MNIRAAAVVGLSFAVACATTKSSGRDPAPASSAESPAAGTEPGDRRARPKTRKQRAQKQASAAAAFRQAVAAVEASKKGKEVDWREAEDAMGALTSQHPKFALGWYNLGVARDKLGKTDQAEDAYRRAVQRDPGLREAHLNLASLVLRKGDHRQAISILRELVERDPGAAKARVALAQSLLNHGQPEDAVRLAQEALARAPKTMEAYCVLTQAAVKEQDHQRVRLLVAQAMKIDSGPASACLHHALAQVLTVQKRTAEALQEYRNVVAKDGGGIPEARFRIAEISLGFKDFRTAVDAYTSVTEIDPKNAAAFVNLGVAYKGGGQFAEAEKAYLQAIAAGGDEVPPQAHFNLGVLYLKNLDRLDDARTQLKRYLAVGNVGGDDPAFAWLEEIDQRKAMEAEMRRMDEAQKRADEAEAARKAKGGETPPVASESGGS